MPEYQAYSKIFLEDGLRDRVDAAYKEHEEEAKESGEKPITKIAFHNKFCKDLYRNESSEVKKQVHDYLETLKNEGRLLELDDNTEGFSEERIE